MQEYRWSPEKEATTQLAALEPVTRSPGLVRLRFANAAGGPAMDWPLLESWVRSRAVTVADVGARLAGGALDVALCCDLVYLRRGVALDLGQGGAPPSAGVVWACGRAGRPALRQGLLHGGVIGTEAACSLGLAAAVLEVTEALPVPDDASLEALVTARDLGRCRTCDPSGALELAAFRLLFAHGHPREGANAFLQGRPPRFSR